MRSHRFVGSGEKLSSLKSNETRCYSISDLHVSLALSSTAPPSSGTEASGVHLGRRNPGLPHLPGAWDAQPGGPNGRSGLLKLEGVAGRRAATRVLVGARERPVVCITDDLR